MSSFDIYAYLEAPQVGQLTVPGINGDILRLDCIVQITKPPRLEVTFMPNQVKTEDIDTEKECMVTLDIGGPTVTLKTSIENIVSNRKLELINIESVNHAQKREYFRIDANVPVDAHNLPSQETFIYEGESINISGSGVLITLPERVPVDKKLKLRINIPEPEAMSIECIAQVVRCDEGKDNDFIIALHFYTIEEEDQDAIIAFCMAQQRKQLRLKVLVLGPA